MKHLNFFNLFKSSSSSKNSKVDETVFKLITPKSLLEQCAAECNAHLTSNRIKVELGGVLIGTFDGNVITVRRFLFDENAQCGPVSIVLSPDIFKIAEEEVKELNKNTSSKRWSIVGTWHTHPSGINIYSSTDETMLFRDQMRIRTDDPSLASAPWVHFIFSSYGTDQAQVRVYTMQLRSEYKLTACADIDELGEQLVTEFGHTTNIGLLVSKPSNTILSIDRYHPDIFEMHREGKIVIRGIWKYYPFERIAPIFEKIFLENFFQKIKLENFIYVRLLHNQKIENPKIEWFNCERSTTYNNINEIINFKEVKIQSEEMMKVTLQNPDTEQTVTLNLSEDSKVCDAAKTLQQKLNIELPPLLYANLRGSAVESLKNRTTVCDDRVDLPDDVDISYVLNNMRDSGLPIYFQTLEISDDKLFELRTRRFNQVGYKTSMLKDSKVLIAGVGLLGSEIALNLATLGVGNISIIDNGNVDWTNIYRQPLYSKQDVYKRKVDTAMARLEEMGIIKVTPMTLEIPSWSSSMRKEEVVENILHLDEVVRDADIVIGALDTFSPRAVLQFMCLFRNRPFVAAALEANVGYVRMFDENAHDGCYCCGFPDPSKTKWPDGGACTLSTLESQKIIAGFATKFIVDKLEGKDVHVNKVSYYAQTMKTETFTESNSPLCSLCGDSGVIKSFQNDLTNAIIDYLFNYFE